MGMEKEFWEEAESMIAKNGKRREIGERRLEYRGI